MHRRVDEVGDAQSEAEVRQWWNGKSFPPASRRPAGGGTISIGQVLIYNLSERTFGREHLLREQGVGSSNLPAPTNKSWFFSI